jgi:coiled-coil domain-containing protein 55
MKQAERRKREQERRIEREVQKEREAEGEEFRDKEEFITSAYRAKLEDFKKMDEEARRQDHIDGWSFIVSKHAVFFIKIFVSIKSTP